MKNYNIKRNREPLTEADVQKGQDFDAFLKTYSASQTPFFKTPKFYMSVVALGVVIAVGSYFLMNDTNKQSETAFVQPALAGIDVADTVYVLDAANGGDFYYNTGSVIQIPEGGFLDSAGNVVKGKVELHYREFHNTADIFLAGIPMTYDSAGSRYHFESAGMMEITAYQDGKPLKVNPASPVKVAMASNSNEEKFNVYYLDTVKKNWDFISKDKVVVVGFVADTSKGAETKVTASIVPPIEIKKADKKKHSFVISFEPKEFPELSVYKGVRFQVDENKTPYNQADKNVKWEEAGIVRNADGITYSVTFSKGENSRTYVTDVVVDDADFAAAKKVYDQKYAEYLAAVKTQKSALEKQERDVTASLMNADGQRIFKNDTALRGAIARRRLRMPAGNNKEDMVVREFLVKDFGIWNSDCPSSLPQGEPMFVKLIDSRTKKQMVVDHLVLVEKGKNAIYTYYASDLAQFRFNKNAENIVWAISEDGHLAVCDNDALQSLIGKKVANLTMTVQADVLKTPEQARAVLGI